MAGAFAGLALGATLGWTAASAAEVAGDGAGYGGTANALQVHVSGERVHVEGAGFLAGSAVQVHVGDLTSTVTADDIGRVDTVLTATEPKAIVAATGIAPDGLPTNRSTTHSPSGSHGTGTALGGLLGIAPAVVLTRKYGLHR